MKRLLLLLALAATTAAVFAGASSAAISAGVSPNPVAPGADLTVNGAVDEGSDQWVLVVIYSDSSCDGVFDEVAVLTNEDGVYSASYSVPGDAAPGAYSVRSWTGEEDASPCVPFTVGTAQAGPPPDEPGIFVCYSAYQTDPAVFPASEASQLLRQGYWLPYAVPNKVVGGTNLGGFHLVCNIAASQAVSSDLVGADGTVFGHAYDGVPGLYPKVGG